MDQPSSLDDLVQINDNLMYPGVRQFLHDMAMAMRYVDRDISKSLSRLMISSFYPLTTTDGFPHWILDGLSIHHNDDPKKVMIAVLRELSNELSLRTERTA